MSLSLLDGAVIIVYLMIIFGIAINSNFYMRKHFKAKRNEGLKEVESHYLGGRSLTFWEAMLSIIATEFSAMAFLTIPTYAYFDNFNYMRFIFGACVSRLLIAFYFLPKIYGKGMTVFEALARGIHGYKILRPEGRRAKRTFALFYIVTKTVGVSIRLLGGAMLVSTFLDIPIFSAIVMISMMTYLYIILGGLKAVVRTDMIQASIFLLGGLMAHHVVSKLSPMSWGELMSFGFEQGKFSLFKDGEGISFLLGILAGAIYDAATHGVDQDQVQKLFGSRDLAAAQKALAWSALGSVIVNLVFLSFGVILWSYYTQQGLAVPEPSKLFSNLIENYFPSPVKGLMIASILAACMSTLDSSINAMSSCFWNDLMSIQKSSKMFKMYIGLDNFIITISIIIVSFIFSFVPSFMTYGLHFAYLSTVPILAFFMCRMVLSKFIRVSFTTSLIFLSVFSCFLGMALNQFRFGFSPHLTTLAGVVVTTIFIWIYSKVSDLFVLKNEGKV